MPPSSASLPHLRFAVLMTAGLFALPCTAQTRIAAPFDSAAAYGIDVRALDATHRPAVGDSADARVVFPGRQEEVVGAWRDLLGRYSAHLRAGGVAIEARLRGFFRFYFRPDGHVERLVYALQTPLADEDAARFEHLSNSFAAEARFSLRADVPFAQCSPARLEPAGDRR